MFSVYRLGFDIGLHSPDSTLYKYLSPNTVSAHFFINPQRYTMSTNLQSCPKIEVLRWNTQDVYLRCPYCERIHHHGFNLHGRRTSHCYPGGEYEYIFPIDEKTGLIGYEIDKKRAYLVNICEKLDDIGGEATRASQDNGYELSGHFRSAINLSALKPVTKPVMKLREDSRELATIPILDETIKMKRILIAMSDCVRGKMSGIRHYLMTTSEKHLFLHGRDENGDTTCIMAAAEKSHEMVSLLLQNGANVNAVNKDGRSALMQAALWGRIETVKALINANADKHLLDHEGRSALDLARPSRQNREERHRRSPAAAADSMPERDHDRQHIAILLTDQRHEKQFAYSRPQSETERSKYGYKRYPSESVITIRGPIHSIPVSSIWKTAADLDRGTQFPRITATSGWGPDARPPDRASAPTWTEQVFNIASVVDHRLEEAGNSTWDQGKPGQFNASHAEKKLIAFFIDKHVFTPEDQDPNEALEESIYGAQDLLGQCQELSSDWPKVCDLEERKKALFSQLWNAEDELLLDSTGDAEHVEGLRQQLHEIDEELGVLELRHDVRSVRSKEQAVRKLEEKHLLHEKLMELSKNGPKTSLKEAVISTSNKICDDCKRFKDSVNRYFNLRIEIEYKEERSN
ncbi:hypothetical protein F5B21DRAFT_494778 [Xylaria acuta]|nr:hypothetical protein F5B21DRAFT_494778 [Xylaria acuta]